MNKRIAWSMFRYVASLLVVLIIGVSIFLWWAVGGNLPKQSTLPIEQSSDVIVPPAPKYLVVASYNIGHGQGVKENAWDYRDKETTLRQLGLVADAMVKMNADVYLLQEVDLDSNRTFHVNQLDFIKERTKHGYHACALVWEKNYLPFPYWPPAHQLGYVRVANCVLSRFPLSNHERIIFDKPQSNPFWYNWGYIDRGLQRVDVDVGGHKLAVINLHLEAWESAAREIQIKITSSYINEIKLPTILGGDFNTILPDAEKRTNFSDDPHVDYAQDRTFGWFLEHAKNLKVPTLTIKENTPFEHFTFPSNHPDRRLDHILLIGKTLSFVDFRVAVEAGMASDHLPVIATIKYKD